MIQDKYPGIPIIPTFGNNDFTLDYWVPWTASKKGDIFNFLYKLWFTDVKANMALINDASLGNTVANTETTFKNGGYYMLNLDAKTSIVAINSIYMSGNVNAAD